MPDAAINFPPVTEVPDAEVILTVIPELPPDTFDIPILNDGSANNYFGAGISSAYFWDYGLAASPVAGPYRSQCAIWREHGGFCKKIVQWVLQRFDELPVCPSTNTGSDNEVLFNKVIAPNKPEEMPNGSILNTICGVYIYVLQIPPAEEDLLFIPNAILLPPADNVLDPLAFTTRLIGPVPGVTDPPSGPITF